MDANVRHIIDWAAVGATVGTLAGWLPPMAAGLSIVWLSIQIYDRLRHGPRK
jgi:hypothetical protein